MLLLRPLVTNGRAIIGRAFHLFFFCSSVFLLATGSGVTPASEDPKSYLEFIATLDGKCAILSQGGKLQSVKNNHASKLIRYRLVRYFAGKPQPSFTVGVVGPGGQTHALGCDRIDGQSQTWRLQSARYVD